MFDTVKLEPYVGWPVEVAVGYHYVVFGIDSRGNPHVALDTNDLAEAHRAADATHFGRVYDLGTLEVV